MTNRGKAKQLMQKWAVGDYAEASTYFASCEMAEWKDEKFKQQLIEYRNKVIKEACNWLYESTNFSSYGQLIIRKNYKHKEDCMKQLEKAIKSKL